MKKIVLIAFMLVTFLSLTYSRAQDLSIENGKSVTIKSGASLTVSGLVLKPSLDHVLAANNSITKTSIPEGSGDNISMSRVYTLANTSQDYVGQIAFQYENAEMGTITHTDAVLEVKNETGTWNDYADTDGVNNTVTHNFTSPIKIKSVTAASGSKTLSVESLTKNAFFKVYPNPVVSMINILCEEDIEVSIFNQQGQLLLCTREKSIDFSSFANGIYILKGRNIINQSITNNFKIIKK
jgi:hypothetical protein